MAFIGISSVATVVASGLPLHGFVFPRIIACGSCFSALHPSAFSSSSSSSCSSSSSHAQLWHKSQLCHAQLFHTRLCHTHTGTSALLQNAMLSCARTCLLDPVLSHTSIVIRNSFSHNFNQLYLTELFHTQHCHPQHPATLSHTTLPRTTLSNSIVTHGFVTYTQQCHTVTHRNFCPASLALTALGWLRWPTLGFVTPNTLSLSHTHAHTHNFVTYISVAHAALSHRTLPHTALSHTHTRTHNFVTQTCAIGLLCLLAA